MRLDRKSLIALAIAGSLLAALLLVPQLFSDRVAARVKAEVDRSVDARVVWGSVGLSIVRDFPNVTLTLNRLSIVGAAPFAGDTLVSVRQARLVLDVGSVVSSMITGRRIVVSEIVLRQPDVRLRVLADGRANWDIARAPRGASSSNAPAIGVTLRDLRIRDASITLDDRRTHLMASVHGLQESLRGDFSRKRFVLTTRTHADSVSLRFAGIPYLSRVAVDLNADLDADVEHGRYAFANDSLRLNNLILAFAGSVTLGKPNIGLEMRFAAPSTDFREILSLVPAVHARDFAQIQTSGTMSASGRVRGMYGPRAFPSFALRARVDNGAFRHPALPMPARDITLDLAIDNPGGHLDSTVVNLKRFHAVIGGRPMDARLVVRTPVADPDVDLRLFGSVNLADVARTVKLEGVNELTGTLAADVAIRARLSDIDAGRYDRVTASGTMNAGGVSIRAAAVPRAIEVDTAALDLTPRTAELRTFAGRIGNSDLRAVGAVDNLLGFALRGDDLRGTATVNSNLFDLGEWKSNEKTTEVIPVPPHVDFTLQASANRVTYGALAMSYVHGDLRVKYQRVTLKELSMETLRGKVIANGFYETTVASRPTFDMDLRLAGVDIPAAFAALTTVRTLAPIAKWAQGSVTGTVGLRGPLGRDMTPVFTALAGKGEIETERLLVQGAPLFEKLGNAFSLEQLRKPTFGVVKAAYDVADGRVHVKPFTVNVNGIDMTVSGSSGIDQSMSYDLSLAVPRAALGAAGSSAMARLASQAGASGADTARTIKLGALVTGTMMNPAVKPSVAGAAASARELATNVVLQGAAAPGATLKARSDSTADAARARARAEGARMVAEAEGRATTIRTEARTMAETLRHEGNVRADSLLARANSPMAAVAAQAVADRLRVESEQKAQRIVLEADARADALVALAKQKADALALARR